MKAGAEQIEAADRLLIGAASLPTLADVPLRVLSLLDGEDVALEDVADQIERDPVLAARVLRLANSPLFGRVGKVDSVLRAVVRLGVGELRTIVLTLAFIDSLGSDSRIFDMREVFREAVCCASLARQLARDIHGGDVSVAYLAGLLHGIGEIVLGLCFIERFERAVLHARRYLAPANESLTQEFGVPSTLVGARLLERWRLPPLVVDAIEHQDAPGDSPRVDSIADLVGAARRTVRSFGIGIEWPGDSARSWLTEAAPVLERASFGAPRASYLDLRREELAGLDETLTGLLPAQAHRTPLLS